MAGDVEARGPRLAALVAEQDLDMLLVTDLTNILYLTGFGGTNGLCLVSSDELMFFTDFRYVKRAADELASGWEQMPAERELLPAVAKRLRGRVGFDDANLSVRSHARIADAAPEGAELVPAAGLVERLRRRKDAGERVAIEKAATLADQVYERLCSGPLVGRVEIDVAREAEDAIRELGGQPAFPVIVAAGEHGAQPHAEPGDRKIAAGDPVVIDMGARLDDYCSDCTRTVIVGEPSGEQAAVYELVQQAQNAALAAVRAGTDGRAVDAAARDLIEAAGHGDRFGHGTGHGVGLEVHEMPRLATSSDDVLEEGDVVTVEPGVYLPDGFGVRIEDLVVVTPKGHDNLSSFPKDFSIGS